MKTLSCIQPGKLQYEHTRQPEPAAGRAIIKIKRIGICGTDYHAFEGTQPFFEYPRILGHELSGEIADIQRGSGFEIGDAVTCIPYFHCGYCIACRSGKPNCCVHLSVCGVHADGGMQEYFSVPDASLVRGAGLSFDQLALVEPLAIGAHGIARAGVRKGEYVLIMGAGPIGLAAMECARLAGAKTIALDLRQDRLQFCKDRLGVNFCIDGKKDVAKALGEITDQDMPTVVVDATGNLAAMESGFSYMAHGARYVLIGLQKKAISFMHPEFHRREGTLLSSRNATRSDFEYVINSMKSGAIDPETYITHRVAFDQLAAQFAELADPKNGVIKAMIQTD